MRTGLILGSDPFAHGAIALDDYVVEDAPAVPASVSVPDYNWGMLGNDEWGDCFPASCFHADEAFYLRRGLKPYPYQTPECLQFYSALTGFNPNAGPPQENPTDQGSDPSQGMAFWRDHGLPGHKLAGFGQLPAGSPNIRRAIWEFGAAMFAVGLPSDAFNQVGPDGVAHWRGSNHGPQQDGHAIVAVAYTPDLFYVVTWGQLGDADNPWVETYLEQVFVPLAHDQLNKQGVGPAGFNFARMSADLSGLA